jgi:uncharacterized membrane protein YeiH
VLVLDAAGLGLFTVTGIYAVASLLGAGTVAVLSRLHADRPTLIAGTAMLVFGVRLVALRRKWQAPTPPAVLPGRDPDSG